MSIRRIKPIVAFPRKQFCVVDSTRLKIQRECIVAFYDKNVNANAAMSRYAYIVSLFPYISIILLMLHVRLSSSLWPDPLQTVVFL
jgi:hypothetical protein